MRETTIDADDDDEVQKPGSEFGARLARQNKQLWCKIQLTSVCVEISGVCTEINAKNYIERTRT